MESKKQNETQPQKVAIVLQLKFLTTLLFHCQNKFS